MTLDEMKRHLGGVTAIPILPFNERVEVDLEAHAKNVRYLMNSNRLDGGLKRVVAVAGTSLIHHLEEKEQTRVMEATGRVVGDEGVLMSGIVPRWGAADRAASAQLALERPPDVFLMMPLAGVYDPAGYAEFLLRFGEKHGQNGGRFLIYMRNARDMDSIVSLLNRSEHFIGVKIGTGIAEVEPMSAALSPDKLVIWGIGERNSTAAWKLGAKGHTSGTALVAAGLADALNNAQRAGEFEKALRLEGVVGALEEIRFRDGRMYNYSAVAEALRLSGFADVEGGSGHPLNPRVPPDVSREVERALEPLRAYH
ncbi:MAG: dihydrodipicolinate synthase family protein [Candidatus Poribacteria bacterium]|nr:dihydrodipicolinate synthase family protein [Candidatus Poribacteria bacterium]